jgi:hypothetical protein
MLPDISSNDAALSDEFSRIHSKVTTIHGLLPAMQESMKQLSVSGFSGLMHPLKVRKRRPMSRWQRISKQHRQFCQATMTESPSSYSTFENWPQLWLLVFDNYDDPIAFNNLQDFIPSGKNGSILITTRHAEVDALGRDRKVIELHGLEIGGALELLLKHSAERKTVHGATHGKCIVKRLGYHPLAIMQTGAYICRWKIGFEDFLYHYSRRRMVILKQTLRCRNTDTN